jgi:hypothetical protein
MLIDLVKAKIASSTPTHKNKLYNADRLQRQHDKQGVLGGIEMASRMCVHLICRASLKHLLIGDLREIITAYREAP